MQRKSTKQPQQVVCLKENFLTLWQLCNGITISLVHFTEELQGPSKSTPGRYTTGAM